MSDSLLAKCIEDLYREGRTGVLITVLGSSNPLFVGARFLAALGVSSSFELLAAGGAGAFLPGDPSSLGPLLDDCRLLAESKSEASIQVRRSLAGPDDLLFLELIHGDADLIICGAGHVGQAIVPIARLLDMTVAVIDDREDSANRRIFPDVSVGLIVEPYDIGLQKVKIRPSSSIVIVTRAHHYDEQCLRIVLNSPARYIGMLGSSKRVLTVLRKLEDEGCTAGQLAKVRAPIGIDIGAQSPAEIAISILAEVILARYGGSGTSKSSELNLIGDESRAKR